MSVPPQIKDEKQAKAKVIQGMLGELGMSNQELIDLIKILTEQSVSKENAQAVEQNLSDIDVSNVSLSEKTEGLPENLSIEQLAQYVADGNIKYLEQYLSLDQLKKLSLRVGLAFSLKRAAELGLTLDSKLVSQLIGIPGINKLSINGTFNAQNGKQQYLSADKAGKLSADVNTLVSQKQLSVSQFQSNQLLAQLTNDPNSLNNPNASINVVGRVINHIKAQIQNIAGTPQAGGTLAGQRQQQQMLLQNMVRTTERAFRNMRRHERNVRSMFPEISKMSRRGSEMTVTVRSSTGGEKQVSLRDYLKESGKYNARAEKLVNKLLEAAAEVERNTDKLSKGLPEVKSFQFDASGRLNVQAEAEGKLKQLNLADYLSDVKRDQDKIRSKAQEKKKESKGESIQHIRDISRGPELDEAILIAQRRIDLEKHEAMLISKLDIEHKPHEVDEHKEKKESKRTSDELVKLDAMGDKQKMLEAMKSTGEMKQIESSMKEVMKNMEEAEKNKDLVKELQLAKKDKFIDKI